MKSIKVSDKVHEDLQEVQRKRESMSDTIARLVVVYREVQSVVDDYMGLREAKS